MKKLIKISLLLLCIVLAAQPVFALTFRDVSNTSWYKQSVSYVVDKNIMTGTSANTFSPEENVTRAMAVTVLYRLEGSPAAGSHTFSDVKKGGYYENAVAWASENGIVGGYSETRFGPDDFLTREQLAAILSRYAGYKNMDTAKSADLSGYRDFGQISAYAKTAMQWAAAEGLITGVSETQLSPQGKTTRAQLATIIMRFDTNILGAAPVQQEEKQNKQDQQKEQDKSTDNQKPQENKPVVSGNQPTLIVGSALVKAGDTVKVAVSVKNNPGILGMALQLTYDESKMTLKSAKSGSAVSKVLTMTAGKNFQSGCRFIWDGVELSQKDVQDGEVLVLSFKIKESAKSGTSPVTISAESVVDNNLAPISTAVSNGSISIG